jgi:hypothetical protein
MALAQNPSIAALSNLVLYYDASNVKSFPGAGTSIYDMSGNNNTGTLTNGASWGGNFNGVINFDGTNDYVEINSSTAFPSSNSARTICISYIPSQINAQRTCLFFHGSVATSQGFMISSHTDGKRTQVQAYSNQANAYSSTDWVAGKLNHLVVTFDGTTVTYYTNGVADGTATFSSTINTINGVNPRIGTYPSGWGGEYSAQGQIPLVMVYNKVLTASEIKQNYCAIRNKYINTPFAPTDISGLSIWFDADDPRTLFSNTSGTTRATTDGNSVALWVDKSGNGRNASQSTSGYQPLLKTSVLNNRNVIRFDGSDDYLSSVDLDLDYITMFVVTKLNTQTDSGNMAAVCGKSNQDPGRAPPYNLFIYGNVGDATYNYKSSFVSSTEAYPASYPYTNSQSTQNDSVFKLHTGRYDGTTRSYYINGGFQSYTTAQSGVLYKDNELFYIGIDVYSFLNRCFNGDIAEIIVYNSALSTTNRLKVEQYLQSKWGIELAFQPTQISGLQLWLDSSDSGSLFQDSAAVIPATNDGDPVGCWKDKSGNSRNVTQSTSANRPVLKTSVQNSKNGIRFDGTNDFLTGSYGTTYSNWTLFVVCKFSSASSYPMVYTDGNNELRLYSGTGFLEIISQNDPLVRDTVSCVGSTIIATPWNGATFALYKNGISLGTGVTQRALASTFYISSRSGSSYYLVGDVYEVITYNAALTTAQRQQVEAYLNQKWGVF